MGTAHSPVHPRVLEPTTTSVTRNDAPTCDGKAPSVGLAPHAPGELGRVRIGVPAGCAFDDGGLIDRAGVAHGVARGALKVLCANAHTGQLVEQSADQRCGPTGHMRVEAP